MLLLGPKNSLQEYVARMSNWQAHTGQEGGGAWLYKYSKIHSLNLLCYCFSRGHSLLETFYIRGNPNFNAKMHFAAYTSPQTVGFLLLILIPLSIASSRPTHLQLRCKTRGIVEKQALLGPLASLFSKRDDCGTQFGPTYVDCGRDGCYQPSLGELCCSDESSMFPLLLL